MIMQPNQSTGCIAAAQLSWIVPNEFYLLSKAKLCSINKDITRADRSVRPVGQPSGVDTTPDRYSWHQYKHQSALGDSGRELWQQVPSILAGWPLNWRQVSRSTILYTRALNDLVRCVCTCDGNDGKCGWCGTVKVTEAHPITPGTMQ